MLVIIVIIIIVIVIVIMTCQFTLLLFFDLCLILCHGHANYIVPIITKFLILADTGISSASDGQSVLLFYILYLCIGIDYVHIQNGQPLIIHT